MRPAAFTIGKSKFQREREEREARLREMSEAADHEEARRRQRREAADD